MSQAYEVDQKPLHKKPEIHLKFKKLELKKISVDDYYE
jgi:hypothetical protein